MNQQVLEYLPVIAPVATLVVVILGVLFQNHHVDVRIGDLSKTVDVRIGDLSKLITAESARLEAVLRLEIERLAGRVKALEERAGLIYRG